MRMMFTSAKLTQVNNKPNYLLQGETAMTTITTTTVTPIIIIITITLMIKNLIQDLHII